MSGAPAAASPAPERTHLQRRWLLAAALGIVSGALYWASMPKPDLSWLAWVSLVPLLYAGLVLPRAPHLLAAALAGLLAGLGRTYWITATIEAYGSVPLLWATLTGALLVAYLAAYWVAHAAMCRMQPASAAGFAWLAASSWVLLEWVQTWMLSGFPWQLFGCTQHSCLPVLQLASVTGVYGISFVLVLVNASLARLLAGRLSAGRLAAVLVPPLLVAGALHHWGERRLVRLDARACAAATDAPGLRVGIVQGNVAQDAKWQPEQRRSAADHYGELTRRLPPDSLDLIVLPETALPVYFDHPAHRRAREQMAALARHMRAPLLLGSLGGDPGGPVYNRVYLLDGQGRVAAHADKVHLVPFGEYLPLRWLFGYLEGLTAESGVFASGDAHRPLPLPGTDTRLGVFICFESVFPAISRQLARRGCSLLVTVTNDAWFGRSAAPWQHLAAAVLRAVETGRPIVRVANTGISAVIEPSGRVRDATELFTTDVRRVRVRPEHRQTPYVRYGDWLVAASGLAWALWGGIAIRRQRGAVRRERQRAAADLEAFARRPLPLPRPLVLLHGYRNHPECWRPLLAHLQRCTTPDGCAVHVPALAPDADLTRLATELDQSLPAGEIDLVGHSMGGAVAVALDHRRRHRRARVLTLAAPLRGTWLARWGRAAHYPGPRQLADMTPGSAFLAHLQAALAPSRGRLYAWRAVGDVVVPDASALVPEAIQRRYAYPALSGWRARHSRLCADERVIRDIIAILQDRAPAGTPPGGCGRAPLAAAPGPA